MFESKLPRPLKDYYRILEVHFDASPEVIDRAYKALARKYHPDRYPAEQQAWANKKMRDINEARAVLMNPQSRSQYARRRRSEVWRLFWREGLAGLSRVRAGKRPQ